MPERSIPVPALKSEDWFEAVFPLTLKPGAPPIDWTTTATMNVLLYRRSPTGDTTVLKREWEVQVERTCSFLNQPTPYATGLPLSNMSAFKISFKGRNREIEDVVQQLRGSTQDNFVVVFGQRKIGKSSLLLKLSMDSRIRAAYCPVLLDLEHFLRFQTTCSFLQEIAKEIQRQASDAKATSIEIPNPISLDDPIGHFTEYLRLVADALGPKRRFLLMFDEFQFLFNRIDEAEKSGLGVRYDTGFRPELITSFRHWVQHLPVAFIVAGTRELENRVSDPNQRLFQAGSLVRLVELDPLSARHLVTQPVDELYEVTARAVDALVDQTQAHPHLLQNACNKLFTRMKIKHLSVATVRDALAALDELALDATVFSHLIGHLPEPATKAVLRALAEIAVDEERGTVDDIVEHLGHLGAAAYATPLVVQQQLDVLEHNNLLLNDRVRRRYRLRPPLLAKYVMGRREFEI